jgi:Lon protease-like protein
MGYFLVRPSCKFIENIIELVKPKIVFDESELVTLPLFICSLGFPGSRLTFKMFEKRDRVTFTINIKVMIKRCLETSKTFGLVLLPQNNEPGSLCLEFGTMMHIKDFIPILSDVISTVDGNLPGYLIECDGTIRFKIIQYVMNSAGFYEARIQMVYDIEPEDNVPCWNPDLFSTLLNRVISLVTDKISILSPNARFHFDRQFGAIPNNPNKLSFWIAQLIPLDSYIIYELLKISQVDQRLELVCKWLERCSVNKQGYVR